MHKFKVKDNFIKNRLDKLQSYTSKQEKECLLNDELSLLDVYKILCPHKKCPKPINELETIAFILKLVEISVSDLIEKFYECTQCKTINNISIEIEDLLKIENSSSDFDNSIPLGLFNSPNDIIKKADNLIIKDYNSIQNKIDQNNEKMLSLTFTHSCRKCGTKNVIVINPIQLVSKKSIMGIYDDYFKLSFYSHIGINDINDMYPFERDVYIGLLKKQVENNPMNILNNTK